MRLAEGAAGAAGSLATVLGTVPALLLMTLLTGVPLLGAAHALRSLLQGVRPLQDEKAVSRQPRYLKSCCQSAKLHGRFQYVVAVLRDIVDCAKFVAVGRLGRSKH